MIKVFDFGEEGVSYLKIIKNFFIMVPLFLINFFSVSANVNAEIEFFDFKNYKVEPLIEYKNYRKCKGVLQASKYGLPIVPNGFVVNRPLSCMDIEKIKQNIGDVVLCRPDAPKCQWYGLPRGRDLKIEEINAFFIQCQKINPSSILLCFLHPSVYFTGNMATRYDLSGACNVIINWEKNISIDFVGTGYDCGELSRGKNLAHSTVVIPWYLCDWPSDFIWNHLTVSHISSLKYEKSRKARVDALVELGYDKAVVEQKIPTGPSRLDKSLFCTVFDECIKKVIKYPEEFTFKIPLMITINIYNSQPHVFEIWQSNL